MSLEHFTTVLFKTWRVVVYLLPWHTVANASFMNCGASSMDERQTKLYFRNCGNLRYVYLMFQGTASTRRLGHLWWFRLV